MKVDSCIVSSYKYTIFEVISSSCLRSLVECKYVADYVARFGTCWYSLLKTAATWYHTVDKYFTRLNALSWSRLNGPFVCGFLTIMCGIHCCCYGSTENRGRSCVYLWHFLVVDENEESEKGWRAWNWSDPAPRGCSTPPPCPTWTWDCLSLQFLCCKVKNNVFSSVLTAIQIMFPLIAI